jgi:hypothetical protein
MQVAIYCTLLPLGAEALKPYPGVQAYVAALAAMEAVKEAEALVRQGFGLRVLRGSKVERV